VNEFMAKRKDTATSDQTIQGSVATATDPVEQRLVAFAEQLGRIVGTVQAQAEGWLDRRTLTEELTRIRDGPADLLSHVGSGTASASAAATPARTKEHMPARAATATTGWRPTVTTSRSGGKVDAPGKTHRTPPAGARGIKHSDEMIPKLKAAQATRRRRHG
jgi:tripartite-type tricarboxylate transporter receptor subunit TctC